MSAPASRLGPTDPTLIHGGSLAFSPDGRTLAAEFHDGSTSKSELLLWDLAGPAPRLLGRTPLKFKADCLTFAPDGRTLYLGATVARVLDGAAALPVALQVVEGAEAFAWGGGALFAALSHDVARVDPASGATTRFEHKHQGNVYAVAASPDGRWVASGGHHPYIHLWDAATGKQAKRPQAHKDGVMALAFSPDGKRLASGGFDNHVALRGVGGKWAPERELLGHRQCVKGLAFSPDGARLASAAAFAGKADSVRLWDAASGELVWAHDCGAHRVAFSPDGRRLAAQEWQGGLLLWDL